MKRLAAIVLSYFISDAAMAISGNELYAYCSRNDPYEVGRCLHYVMGILDGIQWGIDFTDVPTQPYCIPDEATNGQVRDVVKKYLSDHPDQRHLRASTLIAVSLMKSFPCRGK